jgi:signal transduction histidine kinase
MMNNLKLVEMQGSDAAAGTVYFEAAARLRELLHCEYALVATVDAQSLRIRAVAGADAERSLALDIVSKLGNWGPVVVDDSRLIAVPVRRDNRTVGLLLGYSSKPGSFTGDDLIKLVDYSHVVGDMLDQPSLQGSSKNSFTSDELLHLSRLITIGELSACFAHEVTNPLMLIRGHLRFIDEGLPPDSPLRISYEVIDRASRSIEQIAKRMLDFSRKRMPRTEECDIAEVISETLRFMQPYFRGQVVDVQIKLESGLPLVRMDRWQMVQALVNILQNASDAMADSDRRVLTISGRIEENQLRLRVSDTGSGIATADLPRVFNPFFTTKGERGTGLGLFIAKCVVEDHDGRIDAESSGRGATFVISLPL